MRVTAFADVRAHVLMGLNAAQRPSDRFSRWVLTLLACRVTADPLARQNGHPHPPGTFEQRRNDVIFESFQGNRNPFIDHPEWADSIWAA